MRRITKLELTVCKLIDQINGDGKFVTDNLVALAKNIDEVKKSKAEAKEIERLENLIVKLATHVSRLENPPKFKKGDEVEFNTYKSTYTEWGLLKLCEFGKKHGTVLSHYYRLDSSIYPEYKVLAEDNQTVHELTEGCLALYEKKPVKK